jgi:hypothetical protein
VGRPLAALCGGGEAPAHADNAIAAARKAVRAIQRINGSLVDPPRHAGPWFRAQAEAESAIPITLSAIL